MKKIALVSHSSNLHGAERMLFNLALLLKQHQDLTPILILPGEGDFSEVARSAGLKYVFAGASPWYIYGGHSTYFGDVKTSSRVLENILTNIEADLVIINTLTSVSPMLAAVSLNLPSVVWIHGVIDASMIGVRDSKFVYWNENFLLHTASGLVANSNWTASFFESKMKLQGIKVIHNWTDLDLSFSVNINKYQSRQIVCLNTFEKNKGHVVLIEAVNFLKRKGVEFSLDLYGLGPERENIMDLCEKYGLESNVHFKGVKQDLGPVYDAANVVVNPSYVESFGMTLIEAMARKTPVIATRSGGPQDIIVHGENGYLLDTGNSAELAGKIQAVLESPKLSQYMGENAYLTVQEKFTVRSSSSMFADLINSIIQTHSNYQLLSLNSAIVFDWLSTKKLYEVDNPSKKPLEQKSLVPRGAVMLIHKLKYRLHSRAANWSGFEFMIGTHNQIASGRIKIEVFDLADDTVVRSKFLEMQNISDNQIVSVTFDAISDSLEKDYWVLFTYKVEGRRSPVSIYEVSDEETRVKRILRRLGIISNGNTLACRLFYLEKQAADTIGNQSI